MMRFARLFCCILLFCVLMLTVHGCAKPLTEREVMHQRIVRQLDGARLGYTSVRIMDPPGTTNASLDQAWIALNMTGMQRVVSLEGLKGLPIKILRLSDTNVHTLYPLQGMPLVILAVDGTKIRDLEPLRGMPLKTLVIQNTRVIDLSPLEGLPLVTIKFDPPHIVAGMETLRNIATLKYINGMSAARFWSQRDTGISR